MPMWRGLSGQPGRSKEFVDRLVAVFAEVHRVLKGDGTLWVNIGDSYANDSKWGGATGGKHATGVHGSKGNGRERKFTGLKSKDLIGIPWMLAFALRDAGWYLRQEMIWAKPNPMPEPAKDRCVRAHEQIFLLTKQPRYYFDYEAIQEPVAASQVGRQRADVVGGNKATAVKHSPGAVYVTGKGRDRSIKSNRNGITGSLDAFDAEKRNKRSVWTVNVQGFSEAHFATFPPKLVEPMILAGSREGDTVMDPFSGAGTTLMVALQHRRKALGIELNPEYVAITERRLAETQVRLI
jgi:DNA modification methylase